MAELIKAVAVFDEKGVLHQFGPGTENPDPPAWARKKITNPNVWEGDHDDDDDDGDDSDGPPSPRAGVKKWAAYAEANGVDAEGLEKTEVIAAIEAAGVPVE